MHRWNGCICGEDTAGSFLHGDRREEITDKKYSAQFLNPDALSLIFMRVPFYPYIMVHYCLFTMCSQTLSKRFNIKSFYEGEGVKVGASGGWDGGLWNFRCALGRDCDLFCEMKADLWPLHLRWKRNTPFPKRTWTGGTKWAKHTLKFWGSSQWWNETSRKSF